MCLDIQLQQQRSANDEGGRLEVFFFQQPTVFEFFLVVTIEKHCAIVSLSFYVSKLFPDIIYYNKASFIISFTFLGDVRYLSF